MVVIIMAIEIRQSYAKIGIETTKANLEMKQKMASIDLKQNQNAKVNKNENQRL